MIEYSLMSITGKFRIKFCSTIKTGSTQCELCTGTKSTIYSCLVCKCNHLRDYANHIRHLCVQVFYKVAPLTYMLYAFTVATQQEMRLKFRRLVMSTWTLYRTPEELEALVTVSKQDLSFVCLCWRVFVQNSRTARIGLLSFRELDTPV